MKTKRLFTTILTLVVLAVATWGGYSLGRLLPMAKPHSPSYLPPLSTLDLPSQTEKGITATVESYYADVNRLFFVIQLDGAENPTIDRLSIKNENNREINLGEGAFPSENDPSTFYADIPLSPTLKQEQLKGKLSFTVLSSDEGTTSARFTFDFNIPVHPLKIYNVKHTVQANGIDMLLDRLVITPATTQAYFCYVKPTQADWMAGGGTNLIINGKSTNIQTYELLYDSEYGDLGKGGDPEWTPPIQNGRCVKVGFAVGDADPKSVTLTMPMLEQSIPEVIPEEELEVAREKLLPEGIDIGWQVISSPDGGGSSGPVYNKIPAGMSQIEAYQKFLEALGYFHAGPWVFEVKMQQ